MELDDLKQVLSTHLFNKVSRPKDSKLERRDLFGFRLKLPPVYPVSTHR